MNDTRAPFLAARFIHLSNACRLAVVPLVWWGIFGFGGNPSGSQILREQLNLSLFQAATLTAVLLALVSMCTLLPCRIHKRIMRPPRSSSDRSEVSS